MTTSWVCYGLKALSIFPSAVPGRRLRKACASGYKHEEKSMLASSFILFIFAAVLLSSTTALAQTSTIWVTFPAGLNYDLVFDKGVASTRIPVVPAAQQKSLELGTLRPKLRDIVFRNGRPASISLSTEAQFDSGDEYHGPSMVITMNSTDTEPGVYALTFDLVDTNQPGQIQTATFMLQWPLPDITVGPPVVTEATRFFCYNSIQPGILTLQEKSGKGELTGVSFSSLPDLTTAGAPPMGTLEVVLTNAAVPQRTTVKALVYPQGDFPLGKSTGKIEIKGNELDQTLVATYEVHTKRPPILILFLVIFGSLAGFLIDRKSVV